MKFFKKLILISLFILCLGCNNSDPNLIYAGPYWNIKKLNDTVVICIPQHCDLLGRTSNKPYVINIKDFSESKLK